MSISENEIEIYNSFEVNLFSKINLELLLMEKALELNSWKKNDESIQEEIVKEKISSVWSKLYNLIENEKNEADKKCTQVELKNFNEVLFIIVSLIDEFFIRKDNYISEYWNKNLFELAYFNSRNSGSLFFEKIDDIIKSKNEHNKSLFFVYLMCLNMGFKGKYFGLENENEILNYKRSLYSLIFNKSSNYLLKDNQYYLSNIIEDENLEFVKSVKLIQYRKYFYFAIAIIIIYLIYTTSVFLYKKSNLERKLNSLNTSLEFIQK